MDYSSCFRVRMLYRDWKLNIYRVIDRCIILCCTVLCYGVLCCVLLYSLKFKVHIIDQKGVYTRSLQSCGFSRAVYAVTYIIITFIVIYFLLTSCFYLTDLSCLTTWIPYCLKFYITMFFCFLQ